jgi:large subunit ribosomal protein L3
MARRHYTTSNTNNIRQRAGVPFALLGKKIGMTQIFSEAGDVIPVTAVQVGPCVVLQKKSLDKEGYYAVQIGFEDKKKQRVNKPEAGHAKASNSAAKKLIKEVRLDEKTAAEYEVGMTLSSDLFRVGDRVDVIGTSIGKGFAGVMKRHNFAGKDAAHGTHEFFRHGGSIGNRSDPGKVFKNKKMPGHMGNEKVTVQNLTVVAIEPDTHTVLIKGAVPGAKNGYLYIKASVKGRFEKRSPVAAPAAAAETPAT